MVIKLSSPRFKADPHPFWSELRAQGPVHAVTLPDKQPAWLITRYAEAVQVFSDPRFVKDKTNALTPGQVARQPWMPKAFAPLTRNMLDLDDPDHARLRALVNKAFTPSRVEGMRSRIEDLTTELTGRANGRRRIDLIRDFALPLPTTIIAEMLGIPRGDRHRFHRWSSRIVSASTTPLSVMRALPSVWAFLRYIRRLIEARRAAPGSDLVSALTRVEQDGDRLSSDELLAMVFLLLVAGHETTVNLIGNGVLALLEHPDQLQMLRAEPTLVESAVEELLRYGSPLDLATERYTREDVTIGGVTIPQGSLVHIVISSANRDERQFADPDRLDITRDPNRHLSFGYGSHFCIGASLARLEGQIAIHTLLQRMAPFRLAVAPSALRWRPGLVLRGLRALPLERAS